MALTNQRAGFAEISEVRMYATYQGLKSPFSHSTKTYSRRYHEIEYNNRT